MEKIDSGEGNWGGGKHGQIKSHQPIASPHQDTRFVGDYGGQLFNNAAEKERETYILTSDPKGELPRYSLLRQASPGRQAGKAKKQRQSGGGGKE